MMSVPYEVPYQNQLQFNLGVPLAAHNLAVQFKRPSPIFVERVGGHYGIPAAFVSKQVSSAPKDSGGPACNYSTLSEDKMEMMSRLAKRDLRNRKLQSQAMGRSPSYESLSPTPSPSRGRLCQRQSCERFARQAVNKPRKPLTAKEGDKNRRLGAVQTPPPRRPVSHFKVGNDSVMSATNTFMNKEEESQMYFPAKPIMPGGAPLPKDETTKLQQEMEGYLMLIEQMEERAISEPGVKFLHPAVKGKQKDEFLVEEENLDRVLVRIEEQNTWLARNLYNLKQKVKQVQRDVAYADLNKPTKKSQICSQLSIVHRGAVKLIQTFVSQLPYQDLSEGMPARYHELALLLRQLTALNALTKQGKPSDGDSRLLAVLDRVDNLNAKWCLELKKSRSDEEKKNKKPAVTKDWVSDTKVDRNIFVMRNQPEFKFPADGSKHVSQQPARQQHRGRSKKRAPGKENRGAGMAHDDGKDTSELRLAVGSLLQQKGKIAGANNKGQSGSMARDVQKSKQHYHAQDFRKGYLLPHDLIVKREKAQRAVALSKQDKKFPDTSMASSLRRLPGRPNSAPSFNSKHKGVNFDLERQSPVPWIPPGRSSRSRSLSSERRSRSRSPFYLRDLDARDVGNMFSGKDILKTKKPDRNISGIGYTSLSMEKKMRSADVSDSFIDEVEHRLLQRLLRKSIAERESASRNHAVSYPPQRRGTVSADSTVEVVSDVDEPLDTTDLVETVRREAVSVVDAPTLENMKLRLAEMQREQREIRQRWSSLKFTDTRSRLFSSGTVQSEMFRDPPAIEVTRVSKTDRPKQSEVPLSSEWREEPMIFTKARNSSMVTYFHTLDHRKQDDLRQMSSLGLAKPQRRLVTLRQTAVERISTEREKFENFLRKRSHHPSGKFDPWKLVEEISDEILTDCLADVATEVEAINEEIANHMYKSEFMVDVGQSETALLGEHLMSPPHGQPVGDSVASDHEKFSMEEFKGEKKVHIKSKRLWDSGDQEEVSPDKSLSQSLSNVSSRAPAIPDNHSSVLSAASAEPLLEDISRLLHRRDDAGERREETGSWEARKEGEKDEDEKYKDDCEESFKDESSDNNDEEDNDADDDDDDDDKYELDDFEDDSDNDN